jgi:uncharacterized membrane protein YoaK (UPF0700 family)
MAILTGYADVALFLRFQSFATMMTGNGLWLCKAMVEQRHRDALYYTSVIFSYVVGLTIFRKTDLTLKQRTMPVCAGLVAALFVLSDVALIRSGGNKWIPMMLLAAGFGIINSVGTEVAGTLTNVVTGHLTKLTHQVVDRLFSRQRKPINQPVLMQNLTVTFGFLAGAFLACLVRRNSFLPRTFPYEWSVLGILYGLLFVWQDMASLGGAWWLRKHKRFCDLDDDGEICDEPTVVVLQNDKKKETPLETSNKA